MTVGEYIAKLKNNPMFMRNVTSWRVVPERAAALRRISGVARSARGRCAARAGDRAAVHPPEPGDRGGARAAGLCRGHADGVGQDAVLQRAGARRNFEGRVRPRAVPVSDEGAGERSGIGAVRHDRGHGRGHQGVHLRWRHAGLGAHGDPAGRPRRGDQPGHAASGHPAAPREVGEAV